MRESSEWRRNLGKEGFSITTIHYRNGREHAVFPRNSEWGYVHEDKYAPEEDLLRHLKDDAPEVLVAAGILVVSIIGFSAGSRKKLTA